MKENYLEITFRKGKLLAAYLYLPRETGERSQKTVKYKNGIIVDYGKFDRPIGIEFTAPGQINIKTINEILTNLKFSEVKSEDFAPLFVN